MNVKHWWKEAEWKVKPLHIVLGVVLLLIAIGITLAITSQAPEQAPQETSTPTPIAEGSVIGNRVVWSYHEMYEDYTKVGIYVKVMNVGNDGTFTVHVELESRKGYHDKILEPSHQEMKVYLLTGKEKELIFWFYVSEGFEYDSWCTN